VGGGLLPLNNPNYGITFPGMARIGVILCFLLVSAQALAATEPYTFEWQGREYTAIVPPPHWEDRPPLGPIVINKLRGDVLESVCSNFMGFEEGMGCMVWSEGESCHVYVNRDMPELTRGIITYHEVAHCHGWPADHPTD
jgi:hypothetical protein